jgi:hypothetical protein
VNGRKEGVPDVSVKEVDIAFTKQDSPYILNHHHELPLTMDTILRGHGGAHLYETYCRFERGSTWALSAFEHGLRSSRGLVEVARYIWRGRGAACTLRGGFLLE